MIQDLEYKKVVILRKEEETWRHKSRATWLAQGDANRKYFHQFVDFRRITNAMWEIKNEMGELIKGQENLEEDAQRYFKNIYKDVGNHSIVNQLEVISEYPSYF